MQLKLLTQSAVAAAAMSLIAGSAFAQTTVGTNTVTGVTNGSATLARPIQITVASSLAFGTVVIPSSGTGSVVIAASNGAVTPTNAVVLGSSTTSHPSYTIGGEGGQAITVTPDTSLTLTGPGGATKLVSLSTTTLPTSIGGTAGNAGTATFSMGGTLPVGSGDTTGAYIGSYNVLVSYN